MATTKSATRVSEDERLSTASTLSTTSAIAYGPAASSSKDDKHGGGSVASFLRAVTSKFKKHDRMDKQDFEAFLRKLGSSLDFAAAVQQPPLSLFEDATARMRALDRVETFYVRSSERHKGDHGMTVVVDLTVKLPQRQVAQPNGIFVANKDPKKHVLTRDFEEYRTLRELIHFCVGRRHSPQSHEADMSRDSDTP